MPAPTVVTHACIYLFIFSNYIYFLSFSVTIFLIHNQKNKNEFID